MNTQKNPRNRARSFFRNVLTTAAVLGCIAAPAAAQGQFVPESFESTILVSPIGDPGANGKALLAAVRNAQPTEENRLLIWIEPGVYDVGEVPVELKPYLSMQGSGRDATIIRGAAQNLDDFNRDKGLVHGADHSTLQGLTLNCVPNEAQERGACIHLVNVDASPEIVNVSITSEGYGSHWGIRNTFSSPEIENVRISVHGSINNYGVVNSLSSYPTLRRGQIEAADGSFHNSGVFNRDGGLPLVIDDVEIFAAGGTEAFAVYNYAGSTGSHMEIIDSLLVARHALDNGAVRDGGYTLEAQSSTFEAEMPGSAVQLSQSGKIDIRDSELTGSEILAFAGTVRLGSVRLQGGGAVQGVQSQSCAAVFILGDTAEFFENTCPGGGGTGTLTPTRNKLRPHPWSEQAR